MKSGAYADDARGRRHYMGVFEEEARGMIFETWGAKKYLCRDDRGYHLTVSGVSKKGGYIDLMLAAMETGKSPFRLFNAEAGFVFQRGGGLDIKYNDHVCREYTIDGHQITITDNAYLFNSAYTLGLGNDYEKLLNNIEYCAIRLAYFKNM